MSYRVVRTGAGSVQTSLASPDSGVTIVFRSIGDPHELSFDTEAQAKAFIWAIQQKYPRIIFAVESIS